MMVSIALPEPGPPCAPKPLIDVHTMRGLIALAQSWPMPSRVITPAL